jgi:secondary thiamine-phosphate synthase enzyme
MASEDRKAVAQPAYLELSVRTTAREELVDITDRVEAAVRELGLREATTCVYVPHTTAGVTINEGADPAVRRDLLTALARIVPEDQPFEHDEGNSPAHIKTTLVGSAVLVPVHGGALGLGTWQRVFLCEFDGPRSRRVRVGAGGSPSAAK